VFFAFWLNKLSIKQYIIARFETTVALHRYDEQLYNGIFIVFLGYIAWMMMREILFMKIFRLDFASLAASWIGIPPFPVRLLQ
jgi:hypothetical protein